MAVRCLLLEVRILDGRYHGQVDWPPSPFRVFQALVAGAYGGRWVAESDSQRARKDAAFEWLEQCDAPVVASPHARRTRGVEIYVPNNDLDSVGGEPARVAEIRGSKKLFAPHIFDGNDPFLYAWPFDGDDGHAVALCDLAERLHTLGYGIDAAFARGEILRLADAESRLAAHGGRICRPGNASSERNRLQCPLPGSLNSLRIRHRSGATRFQVRGDGQSRRVAFRKAPSARCREIAYEQPSTFLLFDLRRTDGTFHVLPLERALELSIAARDRTLMRLRRAFPERSQEVERLVKGNRDSTDADKAQRLRFYPLPSIGHVHADKGLRRVVVELPPQCPFRADDVAWALSGENLSADRETGEITRDLPALVHAEDRNMLAHYGIGGPRGRCWRTVTPMALSLRRGTGRSGLARLDDERSMLAGVRDALRHAGYFDKRVVVRTQREPFQTGGARAEEFAFDRFESKRLVHVELTFSEPKTGPLVLGDGRFLGLGLFAPATQSTALFMFAIAESARAPVAPVTRAFRRAVMARTRDVLGLRDRQGLPRFFSGHEANGSPSQEPSHSHLYFVFDPAPEARLLAFAPHAVHHRAPSGDEVEHMRTLDRALAGFVELRAGAAIRLQLRPMQQSDGGDRLLSTGRLWESVTHYRPTRHPKSSTDPRAWLIKDVEIECQRHGLPRPTVEVRDVSAGPRGGLVARLRLAFTVAVTGPILLGRDAHFGGGLFGVLGRHQSQA